jgi:hypothetical protein
MSKDMNPEDLGDLENNLLALGRSLPYPPTPNITAMVSAQTRQRRLPPRARLRLALLIVLTIAVGLLAVPPVRAAVLDYIQLGAIRVLFEDIFEESGGGLPGQTNTPIRQREPLPSFTIENWRTLAGETSVEDAEDALTFPLPQPSYPVGLGAPDFVFLQRTPGLTVLLVWTAPGSKDVILSVLVLGPGAFVGKGSPEIVQQTVVSGLDAIWLEGEHQLLLLSGDPPHEKLFRVTGNVLIWEAGGLTYRLEGEMTLEEATRIAESIHR